MNNRAGHYKTNLSGEMRHKSFVPNTLPPDPPIELTEVRTKGNYEQWIKFFLQAILESAEDATATIDKLTILHDTSVSVISGLGRAAKNAMLVFGYLESNPIIEIRKTAEALGIAFNTTSSAINRLVDAGILVQTSASSRNRTFAYEAYLDILRKGT